MTGCVIDTSEKLEVSCAYISSQLLLGQSHHLQQHLWDTVDRGQRCHVQSSRVALLWLLRPELASQRAQEESDGPWRDGGHSDNGPLINCSM